MNRQSTSTGRQGKYAKNDQKENKLGNRLGGVHYNHLRVLRYPLFATCILHFNFSLPKKLYFQISPSHSAVSVSCLVLKKAFVAFSSVSPGFCFFLYPSLTRTNNNSAHSAQKETKKCLCFSHYNFEISETY